MVLKTNRELNNTEREKAGRDFDYNERFATVAILSYITLLLAIAVENNLKTSLMHLHSLIDA